MDYNKFFTFHSVHFDFFSARTDKIGDVRLVATRKNIFFKEGELVSIALYRNFKQGRFFSTAYIRDFMDYFSTGNDFSDYLFDLWDKHSPMQYRFKEGVIK